METGEIELDTFFPYSSLNDTYKFECSSLTFGGEHSPGKTYNCFCYDQSEFIIEDKNEIIKSLSSELSNVENLDSLLHYFLYGSQEYETSRNDLFFGL